MARGNRQLGALSGLLDLMLEVRDARAPLLTMSAVSDKFPDSVTVWTILSKADLANPDATSEWVKFFEEAGRRVWPLDLRRNLPEELKRSIAALAPSSSSRRKYRSVRVAVVGTPNVGKSMLLNRLVGRRAASVGGVPGVTKGVSWFPGPGCIVADSPGILDPRSDARTHRMLAWISSTKGQVIGAWDDLACECLDFLRKRDLSQCIASAWGIDASGSSREVLERIGRRLGKILPGGGVDVEASGRALLDALSAGRLGRLSLERPNFPASQVEPS
ncbi:MAG: 50S ribosome-binding GTPase [Synergistaceae bacterium]|jgi:ribosome biogenesis GTPase A|nr:50S ribosome-binding GTPase [Synergistaceae bacterium]